MWIEDSNTADVIPSPEATTNSFTDLTCPLCLDLFDVPWLLSCDHTICKGCVSALLEEGSILCPTCNKVTLLEGRTELRVSEHIQSQLMQLKLSSQCTGSPLEVQVCDKCEQESGTLQCSTCDIILCSECNKEHHRGKLKNHPVIDSISYLRKNRCCPKPGHQNYRLDLVGASGELLCFLCCQENDLQSQCVSLQEAAARSKSSLAIWLQDSQQLKIDLQKKVSCVDEAMNGVRTSAQLEIQKARNEISKIRDILDNKELSLVSSISSHKDAQLKDLSVLREVVTSNISLLNNEILKVSNSLQSTDQIPDADGFSHIRRQLDHLQSIPLVKLGPDMGLNTPIPPIGKARVIINNGIDVDKVATVVFEKASRGGPRRSVDPSSAVRGFHGRSQSPGKRIIKKASNIRKPTSLNRTRTPPGDITSVQTKRHYPAVSDSLSPNVDKI
eukprot:TRINITY_DN19390_c0_g1_i1.p1 TRINITY_DN19390_c0_g1~~TRINITY_DN19390_c0_g1_i1.p1  ORF type:complete len:444 (+),score=60.04 TRINITY_DN19390_c0_g1_i1:51-1382(+)